MKVRFKSIRSTALAAAGMAALLLAAPTAAGPRAPIPSAPANASRVDALTAFAWKKVAGADHYEFQIGADPSFSSQVLGGGQDRFTTNNTWATLKKTVPNGTYWWHVQAVTKNGDVSAWSSARSIRKNWAAAPVPLSPKSGGIVNFPTTPLTLVWSPAPHAAKYLVSLATDSDLGTLVGRKTVETAATSYTPSVSLATGTYYWAVTPEDAEGNRGTRSRVSSFRWVWPSTTTPMIKDLVDAPELFDPQFSWGAVPGAGRYEVEINSSQDWAPGSKVCCAYPTVATSISPTSVFKDNTYYWRVRAIDLDGDAGVWNIGPTFTKYFDNVPPVTGTSIPNLHMRDNLRDPGTSAPGFATSAPIVTWSAVPGATSYEVEVVPFVSASSGCNWNATQEHWRVTTATTAWSPLGAGLRTSKPFPDRISLATDGSIGLAKNQHYCVRVRARSDRDSTGADVYGDFTYLPDAFAFTGYSSGCQASCGHVVPKGDDYLLPGRGEVVGRMPVFTWNAVPGAGSYFVIVAKDPSFTTIVDYAFTQIPAYAPRTNNRPTTYSDETTSYYWAILPATYFDGRNAAGDPLSVSAADFQKRSTPPPLISPAGGANVPGPPTFAWTAVEAARRYRLQVSQDPNFGTLLADVLTDSTAYTSDKTFPAASQLYWRVRADDENLVGLTWSERRTFQNRLPAPVPSRGNPSRGDMIPTWSWEPVRGAVSYDMHVELPNGTARDFLGFRTPAVTAVKMTGTGVFHWRVRANFPLSRGGAVPGPYSGNIAFIRTIQAPGGVRALVRPGSVLFRWNPKLGAKQYRLQVSTRPDFAQPVENVSTDNTSYAPLLTQRPYEEGGTFYWRVSAVDADNNVGQVTPTKRFTLPMSGAAKRGKRG